MFDCDNCPTPETPVAVETPQETPPEAPVVETTEG